MSYLQPYPSKIRSSLCRVPGIGVLELHCEVGPAKHQKMTELARPSICWMFNVFVNLHQIDLKIVELAQMTPLSSHHIGPHCHSIFDTSFSPIHLPMKHLETSSIWQHTIILAKLTKLELQANTSAPVTWQRPHKHSPFRMPLPQMELSAFGRPYHAGMCQAGSGSETLQRKS